jgi:hypothetical protein
MCATLEQAEEVVRKLKLSILQNDLDQARDILRQHSMCKRSPFDLSVDGTTALVAAVQQNKVDFVDLLMNHGADPTVPDDKGHTPYFYIHAGNGDCLRSLLVHAGVYPADRAL